MLGIGGTAALAGCLGDDGDDQDQDNQDQGDDQDNQDQDDDQDNQDQGDDQDNQDQDDGLPPVSGTYDTNSSGGFETLNPIYNNEDGAGTAIGRSLDQGYTFNPDNEVVPLLYDLEPSDSTDVWVFSLRENLQFSDPYGQVTAEDFVYYIQEIHQAEEFNSASSQDWQDYNVEQTGELEFQAELTSEQVLWPESFEPLLYPIPQGLLEPYVAEADDEGLQQDSELLELQFTGNLGGFVLDEWNRGSGTVYSRNENYYVQEADDLPDSFGNAPYFEGASISVVEEQQQRLNQLETGEVDAAAIPEPRFEEFQNKDNVTVNQVPQPFNSIAAVNMRDNGWTGGPGNLFRYKEFRQAIATAVNKNELIQGVLRGLGDPHFTWQPRFSQFYPGDDQITQFGVEPNVGTEQARELAQQALDRSEFDYQFDGDTIVTPEGDSITLEAYHSAGQETEQLETEFVGQAMEEAFGITVNVQGIDGTQYAENYWTATPEGGTDTVRGEEIEWANPGPNNPGPRSVTASEPWDISLVYGLNTFPRNPLRNQLFFDGANSFYNPVGYYPEDFDPRPLFEQARNASTVEGLREPLNEVFVNIAEEQPYIMLSFGADLSGYNPDLVGPIEDFSNGWNFPSWRFEQ